VDDSTQFMDLPEGVDVEHDPTIAYLPPGVLDGPAFSGGRIHGAFGWALVFERGPRAGMAYVLGPGRSTVGRAAESDIFLDDVTVSRHHGSFTADGETLVVEDHGSTNGTYVNGQQTERARLKPGDEVIIGKYHLIVARGDG
jgi:hypothetical protein